MERPKDRKKGWISAREAQDKASKANNPSYFKSLKKAWKDDKRPKK